MMQITFERTGGFMGRKISVSLNLDELPADQSSTLKRLVDESNFFALDDSQPKTSRPDEFHYTITIINPTIQHTVHVTDSSLPEELRLLLSELKTHAKNSR
jgi:hypothetical protein